MPETKNILIAPSLLSADFSRMGEAVKLVESSGGDWIHLDIMDGSFVPNISFGPKMVADIRPLTDLPLDVHLMIDFPERIVQDFARSGANHICFHLEGNVHVNRIVHNVKLMGLQVGISLIPSTPVEALSEVLDLVDIVLVMTVNPGLSGQEFIPECLHKVRHLDELRQARGYGYLISVDGGINRETVRGACDAGADVLVTGRSFFNASNPVEEVLTFKGSAPTLPSTRACL